jgi:hypothetical protein
MTYVIVAIPAFLFGVLIGRVWEFSVWANKLIHAMQ